LNEIQAQHETYILADTWLGWHTLLIT